MFQITHQFDLAHRESQCVAIVFFFNPSLSLPGALKGSDAVLESDAPNARLRREPTKPDFVDSVARDSHVAAFFTYISYNT